MLTETITVNTTGSAGSATGDASSPRIRGLFYKIKIDYNAAAPGATTDVVITTVDDSGTTVDIVLTLTNTATDTTKSPTIPTHDNTGVATGDRILDDIPQTIERLSLSGATDREVGTQVTENCELGSGKICTDNIKLEYKNFKGDYYSVQITKFRNQQDYIDARDQIISFSTLKDGDFLKFERHELGWFTEKENLFTIVQKGVCQTIANQPETCSYPYELKSDDVVVSEFVSIFTPK